MNKIEEGADPSLYDFPSNLQTNLQNPDWWKGLKQLEQLIALPNQPKRQMARWLNLIADLQVREGGDLASAKAALERLIEIFPDSPAANLARNRIELLKLELKAREKSQTVRLGSYEQNIGLKRGLS